MKNRSKNKTKNRTKNKIKNRTIRKLKNNYEMHPIYGGTNYGDMLKLGLKTGKKGLGMLGRNASKTVSYLRSDRPKEDYKKFKENSLKNAKYISETFGITNSGNALTNLVGTPKQNPNSKVDITYAIGNLKNTLLSGLNFGNEQITRVEKDNIIKALGYLKDYGKINQTAYDHAIKQINKKDGVLGIVDTAGSLLSPLKGIASLVSDSSVPADINNLKGRQTQVKVLQFPKSSKRYGKSNKGIELDNNIVVVSDFFPTTMERIEHDLNSVDNFFANGCIGVNCQSEPRITAALTHEIDITNNVSKKKILKDQEALARE